jgi:hypothetical protein
MTLVEYPEVGVETQVTTKVMRSTDMRVGHFTVDVRVFNNDIMTCSIELPVEDVWRSRTRFQFNAAVKQAWAGVILWETLALDMTLYQHVIDAEISRQNHGEPT